MSFRERIEAVRTNAKLTDEERKAQLEEIYDEMDQDSTTKTKDLQKWKAEARKKGDIDPDAVTKLESEVERLTAENQTLSKAAKKFETDAKGATEKLTAEQKRIQNLEVDRALTESLTKAKVKPELLAAAKALLRDGITLEPEGEGYKAVAKWKDKDGKDSAGSLSDFIEKNWTQGEGKAFILADGNGGSGGRDVRRPAGSGKTATRAEIAAMAPDQQLAFAKEGGSIVD
jgi:chromosome segregation ATPase